MWVLESAPSGRKALSNDVSKICSLISWFGKSIPSCYSPLPSSQYSFPFHFLFSPSVLSITPAHCSLLVLHPHPFSLSCSLLPCPKDPPPLSPVLSTLYFTCTVPPCLLSSSFTNAPCAFVSPDCLSPPPSPVPLTAAFPLCLHPPPSPLHPSTLTLAILTPPFSRPSRRTHHVT